MTSPQRLGAAWFLGFALLGLLIFAVLRGAGRVVLPLLLAVGVGVLIARAVRSATRPLP